jgi:hypothetical protein
LRAANIRAELYLGNPKNMGNQLKYADRRASPCVIMQGSDEKEKGKVIIKNLVLGASLDQITDRKEYLRQQKKAQSKVSEKSLVRKVREIIHEHQSGMPKPKSARTAKNSGKLKKPASTKKKKNKNVGAKKKTAAAKKKTVRKKL